MAYFSVLWMLGRGSNNQTGNLRWYLSRSPEQRSNENQSIVQKFPFNSDLNAGGCFARWWD